MKASDAIDFRFNFKTDDFSYHLDIEKSETPDLYKVRYGRGIVSNTFLIPYFIWTGFLEGLKEIGIFNWDEIYDFPSFDGEGWFLNMTYPQGRELSYAGRKETPPGWDEFLSYIFSFTERESENENYRPLISKETRENIFKRPEAIPEKEPISDFKPDFMTEKDADKKLRLEDIFTEEELSQGEGNAFDRQVAKFSSFVKTGSHTFINLLMDSFEDDKEDE